jgi:hypothetical protein
MKLKILGLEKEEAEVVNEILNREGLKIEAKMGEEIFLEVNIKKYGKVKTNEYEICLRLFCSEKTKCSKHFFETNVVERDLIKGIHKVLDKLENEVEHRLHLKDQNKR